MDKEQAQEQYKVMQALDKAQQVNEMYDLLREAKAKDTGRQGLNKGLAVAMFMALLFGCSYWLPKQENLTNVLAIWIPMIVFWNTFDQLNINFAHRRLDALTRLVEKHMARKTTE